MYAAVVLNFYTMQLEFSCVKHAWFCLLCQNQIREVIMDSDSDEDKSYTSQDLEDEQPHPPSRRSSVLERPSPDYSSSSEDEDDGSIGGQQPQPCQWTLPPKPGRCVVHTFIGATNGKSSEAAHITPESTPLSVLLLFIAEIVTLLVVETNRYYHHFLRQF